MGFFQVFACIYIPVWIDHFSPKEKKTMMLTMVQLAVPLGIVLGYIMSAILIENLNWKYSFYVQGVLFAPIAIVYLFYPSNFMEIKGNLENEIEEGSTGTTK